MCGLRSGPAGAGASGAVPVTAGDSAAREAARLRHAARGGLWRRVLAWLGLDAGARRREAVAARWDLGAAAEAQTANMLIAVQAAGWHVLHDRALPRSRANLDHVLVSPCGTAVVVLDTKRWHAQRATVLLRGRVHCGTDDRHGQIEAVARYAARVSQALGVPGVVVWPLLVVHGSPVAGWRRVRRAGMGRCGCWTMRIWCRLWPLPPRGGIRLVQRCSPLAWPRSFRRTEQDVSVRVSPGRGHLPCSPSSGGSPQVAGCFFMPIGSNM
ncbi:NERD domain-containing protein [Streptomyces sp. NPDC007991]|uniref:nuclease-related domain-containing protein n=1 Tax=Streptomyces sp. NPDC007991 TaxID=3364803 RepID=UPI0036E1BF8A